MQIVKILKYVGLGYLLYFVYCFTRGVIFGVRNGRGLTHEEARKVATFRG